MTRAPLVTVAIPLYRSARFVDNIVSNIGMLTYEPVEILISDRHGLDDAIDQLEVRYRQDPRVRFLRATDGIDWAAHYNELLKAATGTYFCCMPHDDAYATGYVEGLVARLEACPDAIVACGVTHYDDTVTSKFSFTPPPVGPDEPPSVEVALRLLLFWGVFQLVHGIFRRDLLLRHRLFLPRTRGTVFADICWAFSIVLYGRVEWVPGIECVKHYQTSSASSHWHYGVWQGIEECRVMSAALWASPHPRLRVLRGIAVLIYVALVRIAWRILRRAIGRSAARGPSTARSRAFGPLWRWLAPRGVEGVAPKLHVGRVKRVDQR